MIFIYKTGIPLGLKVAISISFFQINVPLFMMKISQTISQHFNMQNIVTSVPQCVIRITAVVPKIQVVVVICHVLLGVI